MAQTPALNPINQLVDQMNQLADVVFSHPPEQGVETTFRFNPSPLDVQAVRGGGSLEFSNPYTLILDHEEGTVSVFRPNRDESIFLVDSDGSAYPDAITAEDIAFLNTQIPLELASQQAQQEAIAQSMNVTQQELLAMSVTETEVQEPSVETAEPEAKLSSSVDLKPFNGGATIFGEAAVQAAVIAGMDADAVGRTKNDGVPFLRIGADQIEAVTAGLEAQGVAVNVKEPPQNAYINVNEAHGVGFVYGKAAIAAAEYLEVPTELTDKGNPKLRLDLEQVDEVVDYLESKGFKVETKAFESTQKPKVLFREHPDGEQYIVYDASAKNLAKAMGLEVEQTPGGRPTLEFDRASYRQIKNDLLSNELDISTKDLKLEARISTYEMNGKTGAVLVGDAAKEVAAALALKADWTKPSAKTGKPLPKVKLTEEQVDAAQEYLEAQGYTVSLEPMPDLGKTAILKTHVNGGMVFGEPAEAVAAALDLELGTASNGNPMLKLSQDQLEEAKQVLVAEGYTLKEEKLPPLQQQGDGQAQGGNGQAPAKPVVAQNGAAQPQAAVPEAAPKNAVISTFESGEIMAHGDAATVVAEALGVEAQVSKKGTTYVKTSGDNLPTVSAALEEAGFAVSTKPFIQPQKAPVTKPVVKAQGSDGR